MPTTQEIEEDKLFLTGIFAQAGIASIAFTARRQFLDYGEDAAKMTNLLTLVPSRTMTFNEQQALKRIWRTEANAAYNSQTMDFNVPSLQNGRLHMISDYYHSAKETHARRDVHPIFAYTEPDHMPWIRML